MVLPVSISKAARRYETIKTDGLTLYPVLVKEYDEFILAKPAIEVMQQSFPVKLMGVPLLSAVYQMDFEAVNSGKQPSGLFSRTLLALALSLRLGAELAVDERVRLFQIVADREKPELLVSLRFTDADGVEREIRPTQYKMIREIIAVQNGVRLESERANPDIVKAQKDMASAGGIALESNTDDLISAVSAITQTDEAEIEEWAILKLMRRSESILRTLSYLVCGFGEMSGVTWKGGNPTPHPFYRRADGANGVLSRLGGEAGGKISPPPQKAQEVADAAKNL